jgi:ATP-dependent Clp protease protease subunit
MEDRSNELEKKEKEGNSSGMRPSFKDKRDGQKTSKPEGGATSASSFYSKKNRSLEDLLNADEDLGIDEIDTLEQYTLQKITTDWLNWNAQFFDYSDEPYLFYLASLLSKDEKSPGNRNQPYSYNPNLGGAEGKSLLNMSSVRGPEGRLGERNSNFDVYSAFRDQQSLFNPLQKRNFSLDSLNSFSDPTGQKQKLFQMFNKYAAQQPFDSLNRRPACSKLLSDLARKDFLLKLTEKTKLTKESEKALGQRYLSSQYSLENSLSIVGSRPYGTSGTLQKAWRALDSSMPGGASSDSFESFRDYSRKQTERTLLSEESKKVFVIINSFGGSVGNGITVHDALQFIKAGSLTLALGVAASAASLALAGGTIGERYVTEGCHVMIHQPEGALQGQASDIWIDSQEILKIRLDVAEIYSLSTYRPRHKILRDLDRDFYLTATETISYGLADEIATNEVMHDIIEMTSKVWDYHESKQQRLLETRESAKDGLDTQTQN